MPEEKQSVEYQVNGEVITAFWAPWLNSSSVIVLVPNSVEESFIKKCTN